MAREGREQSARLRVVRAGLAAPVGVCEGVDPLDAAGDQILAVGGELLRHVVDAADGRDYPYLVAHGDASVPAAEAHEGLWLDWLDGGD